MIPKFTKWRSLYPFTSFEGKNILSRFHCITFSLNCLFPNRCVELLKQLLYRACCVDDMGDISTSVFQSDYFGLALINSAAKTMRDLYDRSSRRPISTPKIWLIEDLLEREINKCKTEQDFVELLSSPVLRICPFLVSFKRRLKLFDRIVSQVFLVPLENIRMHLN